MDTSDRRKRQAIRFARALARQDTPTDVAGVSGVRREAPSAGVLALPALVGSTRSDGAGVGIWRPFETLGGIEFRRVDRRESWLLWADVPVIPPKGRLPRVVLLGESTARGFLCEPYVTPAAVLRQLARARSGEDTIDVVDLARTGLSLTRLFELVSASTALSPDLLVLFAGNNWIRNNWFSCGAESSPAFADIAPMLRAEQHWRPVAAYCEEAVREQVRIVVRALAEYSTASKVPIVLVIPEFNVADWRSVHRDTPMLFERTATVEWHAKRRSAERLLACGQLDAAEEAAREMSALDGGTSAAHADVLGECHLRRGHAAEARDFFEQSRMASLSLPVEREPSCYRIIQTTLREEACRHGLSAVDLPAELAAALGGDLPDRRFFLDFCHLSVEGIQVAMAAVLRGVQATLGLNAEPGVADVPAPDACAESHFVAALFNAALGQRREIIRHHCERAVNASPAAIAAWAAVLDAYVRKAPAALSRSVQSLRAPNAFAVLDKFLQEVQPVAAGGVNFDFVTSLRDAIVARGDRDMRGIDTCILEEHGLSEKPTSLLARFGRRGRMMQLEEVWIAKSAFFRAFAPRTELQFVVGDADVQLVVTYRTPADVALPAQINLRVNGRHHAVLPASPRWRTDTITLPRAVLGQFPNILAIDWPTGAAHHEIDIERAARWCEIHAHVSPGNMPGVFPHWGDLQRLTGGSL